MANNLRINDDMYIDEFGKYHSHKKQVSNREDIEASNEADAYAARAERNAQRYWDSVIEW